jgi:hypothetical protein
MNVTEILTIISAATAAVVAIINALKAKTTAQHLDTNTALTAQTRESVQKVQALVNGQSEALKLALEGTQAQLAQRDARVRALEAELTRLRLPREPHGG